MITKEQAEQLLKEKEESLDLQPADKKKLHDAIALLANGWAKPPEQDNEDD
jgi:hypothetical protein